MLTKTTTMFFTTKVFVFLAIVAAIASTEANDEAKRRNKYSELLKPENNAIDHAGPSHQPDHLLGHRGEHHEVNNRKKMRKNRKKVAHNQDGSQHDSFDDIRLQDLSYDQQAPKKHASAEKSKNNGKDMSHHKKKYMKKLEHWKSKTMGKQQQKKQKHGKKGRKQHSQLP